jgi:rhodanese-related sulfurtransferase
MPSLVPFSAPGVGDLRDAAALFGLASCLGLGSLASRTDVPWLAPEPEPAVASCVLDDDFAEWSEHAMPRIAVDEVLEQLPTGRLTVVDCRSVEAFSEAHIPGALSVPAAEAEALLGTQTLPIPPDHLVVAYCDGDGSDAESVGRLLGASAGCSQVHVLDGGFGAWVASGAPVTEVSRG